MAEKTAIRVTILTMATMMRITNITTHIIAAPCGLVYP
jgi:hypothetical protein